MAKIVVAGNLQVQLNRYSPSKLRSHIEGIKRKTKGFYIGHPTKKISRLGNFFSDFFTAYAQSCDSLVYLYNDVTVD
jgi:hypothetical protein